MSNVPATRRGPPRALQPSKTLRDRLWRLGFAGFSAQVTAGFLGVCRETLTKFFNWHPEMSELFYEAKEAGVAARKWLDAGRVGDASNWEPGTPCPTCGGRPYPVSETITLTRAELDDARKAFDDLIDRHVAARKAAGPQGQAG